MSHAISRRKMLYLSASMAAAASLPGKSAMALDLGSIFGTVGAAIFPAAALGLAGFSIIKTMGNANDLIAQTQQLETHIDQVVSQIQDILKTVQTIVADCAQAVQEVERLVAQLPAELSAAFNQAAATAAFANLQADAANMKGLIRTRATIKANDSHIQSLCEKMVNDISQLSATQTNPVQFAMQVAPALSVWVQGYTAYNMLLPSDGRGDSPWDHDVVQVMTLPKFNSLITSVNQQKQQIGDLGSVLPMKNGLIYQFDGSKFTKTANPFALTYAPGLLNGPYYAIWPGQSTQNLQATLGPQVGILPPHALDQQMNDFCYLLSSNNPGAPRIWSTLPSVEEVPQQITSPDLSAARVALLAYKSLVADAVPQYMAFQTLTDGFGVFQRSVQDNLVTDQTPSWNAAPAIP